MYFNTSDDLLNYSGAVQSVLLQKLAHLTTAETKQESEGSTVSSTRHSSEYGNLEIQSRSQADMDIQIRVPKC